MNKITTSLLSFALVVAVVVTAGWTLDTPTSDDPPSADVPTIVPGTYGIDLAHSAIGFRIKHLGISTVEGNFDNVDAMIMFDSEELSSLRTEATMQVASIDTDNTDRDDHLRSADFFNVEEFPTMTFKSTNVDANDDGTFTMTGDLTIRDVTQEVTLDGEYLGYAKDPWGNEKIGFTAEGMINRKDFGLTWNQVLETGGLLVGEEVSLVIEVQGAKQ